jgi:glutaredoxin-related protein
MSKIKLKDCISLKETFESNNLFYIVMELWIWNWEEYIKMRDTGLSIDEIKQVLIQKNNTLKLTLKEN